jgi:hypothetical protein
MYSETEQSVTFFQSDKAKEKSTDKKVLGVISKGVKDDRKEDGWRYEQWQTSFIGEKCAHKAANLQNKTRIVLKKWEITNEYIKNDNGTGETKYYAKVYDFDLYTDENKK